MDAIVLKNISKKYNLSNSRPLLVKSFFSHNKQEKLALKNVSLNIKKGETVGIIGENGSGKSTLLKIISGITTPTSGSVKINGKVASLIELGAGFHPDLTGKENIYLNATLLGLSKKEIGGKFKEIVDFADIGEYINQPIRTYSSGMVVRLGFSVAIHLDPDILLVDEVLAVGDENFQRKCIEIISKFKKANKTIIFVSHSLQLIETLCNQTILINDGKIVSNGNTFNVIKKYISSIRNQEELSKETNENKGKDVVIKKIELINRENKNIHKVKLNSSILIRIHFSVMKEIAYNLSFGIKIHNNNGYYCHGTTSYMKGSAFKTKKGKGIIDYRIHHVSLLPQDGYNSTITKYYISAFVQSIKEGIPIMIDYYQHAKDFFIETEKLTDQHGVVYLDAKWSKIRA